MLQVHIVADNYATHKTPAVQEWLAKHPRFHIHFTPTSSSWLNQVERWFGLLTGKLLRRGVHKSVRQLEKDILAWVDTWNEDSLCVQIRSICTHARPAIWRLPRGGATGRGGAAAADMAILPAGVPGVDEVRVGKPDSVAR